MTAAFAQCANSASIDQIPLTRDSEESTTFISHPLLTQKGESAS